jgi:DNA invertase Pin-like site-specific DNA recombinase
MKIAIYSRVSTEKQDAENQLDQLRADAAQQGWEVVEEFIDTCTGGTSDREAFQRMFQAAQRHEFELVLFWSLDRLSREGTEITLRHLRILRESGVGYKSHEEQYLDTTNPLNEVFISFKAVMAVEEKKRISQRTKAGLAIARSRGVKLGRAKREIDSQRVLSLLNEGLSRRAVSRQLNIPLSTLCDHLGQLEAA